MRRPQWRVADFRLVLVGAFFVLAWGGIGYRLVQVQGVQAADFAQRGFDQRIRHEEILPDRGTIFDREGVELAVTVKAKTLIADPLQIDDPVETAALIAPIMGIEYLDVVASLEGDRRFSYVGRRLERPVVEELEAAISDGGVPGLSFIDEPKRLYPAGDLAAHVIGLTQLDDGSGIEGLELVLDDVLHGRPGKLVVERDPGGRAIPQGAYVIEPAEPGADVLTTIDREIQHVAQITLSRAVAETESVGGSVVVLAVGTGEILAMASAPGFDPNDRETVAANSVRNRAVNAVFEPGSTLKVVTIAAALEEGVVHPGTVLETPRTYEVGPEEYSDSSDHGRELSVADIVAYSSNIGTIRVQELLGNERQYEYLDAFGLGRAASIDFAGESTGQLEHVSRWCHTSCGPSAAIGYGVGATALQMANIFATIANDGDWVEPHIVTEIIESNGDRIVTEPRRRTVLSAETAHTMRALLRGVVERGTGSRAAVNGYAVGGKTGTTDKFLEEEGVYSNEVTVASFMGIAPIDNPEVVIAVVLDSPRGQLRDGTELKFGGASAAPIFSEIASAVLHQLGISPLGAAGDE